MSEFETAMSGNHNKWLKLFAELRSGKLVNKYGVSPDEPAAPHLPVTPEGYDPDCVPSILFIGQAPRGPMTLDGKTPAEFYTAEACYDVTREVLSRVVTGDLACSPFWCFAKMLSAAVAERTGVTVKPLANVVWSNVAKIADCDSNVPPPRRKLWEAQRLLAGATLTEEVATYRPTLVVVAVGNLYEVAVRPGLARYAPGIEDRYEGRWAWRWTAEDRDPWITRDRRPAVFWCGHPARKSGKVLASWVAKAATLVP